MSEESGPGPPDSGGGQGQNLEGKCILDWTIDDVKTWLSAKNYTPGFVNALDDTDGSVLATLTLDMMDDINATPRLKKGLMKKVEALLRKQQKKKLFEDNDEYESIMETRGTPVQSGRTLADGFPSFEREAFHSPPSVPANADHGQCVAKKGEFGVLEDTSWNQVKQATSRFWNKTTQIVRTEDDFSRHVCILLEDIVRACGLNLTVTSQGQLLELRPDIWIFQDNGLPVGVIEVKKSPMANQESVLDNPNVLGEIYDFLNLLPCIHNITPAIGILTCMTEWRVCWLADTEDTMKFLIQDETITITDTKDGGDVNTSMTSTSSEQLFSLSSDMSTPTKSTAAGGDRDSPPGKSPSQQTPQRHKVKQEQCNVLDYLLGGRRQARRDESLRKTYTREVFCTDVYYVGRGGDGGDASVMRLIASALLKMSKLRALPRLDVSNVKDKRFLKFVKGQTPLAIEGLEGNLTIHWDRSPRANTKHMYALEDLGRGADGKVYLAATTSGSICVLKFSRSKTKAKERLDHEKRMWHMMYPDLKKFVKVEIWSNRYALQMPHLSEIPVQDRNEHVDAVRKVLERFNNKGYKHGDVRWRNIGVLGKSSSRVIVFDMTQVKKIGANDKGWIDDACKYLECSSSESPSKKENMHFVQDSFV